MPASPAKSPSKTASERRRLSSRRPPLAPGAAPLCYVVDEESSIRQFLSLVLHGSGIDTVEFADGAALRKSAEKRVPDLIFHNISLEFRRRDRIRWPPSASAAFAAPCN